MIGIGIANSLGVNLSGLSPAAKSFVTAAGISDPTKVKAINDLVIGLQSSGLWSKMKAVYPFVTDNRNLLGYTEDFSNAYWNKLRTTITANATTAPDGTLTADALFETAVTDFHGLENASAFTLVNGSTYTQSIYIKPIGRRYIALTTQWGGGTLGAWFDTDTTSVFSQDAGITASISTASNGFYRITITRTSPTTIGYFNIWFDNSTPTAGVYFTGNTYLGDVTKGFYLWGAQLELGSTATTYQPIATTQQAYISNQFKYNLKDPRDLDAAFRLVFNGGWTHSVNGATPNGTNGYADTFLVPSSVLTLNDTHLSFYSRTQDTSKSGHDISSLVFSPTRHLALTAYYNSITNGASIQYIYPSDSAVGYAGSTQGLFISSRVSSTSNKLYRNSSILGTNTTLNTSTLPTTKTAISANNATTAIGEYQNRQTAFATIGDGLTDDDATNLYYYTQVFQTTLGRQVGSPAYALPTTYDASAKLYLSAIGSTTDSTLNNAVDTFIKGLKADGIYSKMKAVYPFATDNRNLIDYSEDFSNALWNKGGATISANSIIAPNGTLTADKLNEDNTNAAHYAAFATGKMLTTNTYTVSAYLKAGERIWGAVYLYTGTSPLIAFFNLSNGTIGNTDAGVTATMTDVGNGWYRCTTTAIIIGSSNANGGVLNAQNNGTWIYTGTSGNGIYAWGAQLELGSTATTYQPILTTQQAYISSQFKYNMVNPQDDDSAFRLVFNGGWTHSSTGATPNGTNGYADTKLVPSSVLTLDSNHISFYSRTNSNTGTDMGVQSDDVLGRTLYLNTRFSGNFSSSITSLDANRVIVSNSDSTGFYITSRSTNTSLKSYKNSILQGTNTTAGISSQANAIVSIGCLAYKPNAQPTTFISYSARQCAFSSIGDGLTDTEAANLYSRVQALQTALSRQV